MEQMIEKEKNGKQYDTNEFTIGDTLIHKGFAVLLLLGIHVFVRSNTELYTYNWTINGKQWLNVIFYNLKTCVTIFVFLSGYGLNESYNLRKSALLPETKDFSLNFVKSHLLKLYTNFWVVFLLFAGIGLLFGYIDFFEEWHGVFGFVIDFLGLQDIVTMYKVTYTLNPTWWYMSTIIILYLIFPLVKCLMNRCSGLPVLIGIGLNFYAPYSTNRQVQTGVIFYFASFALGMLCSEKNMIQKIREWWQAKEAEVELHTFVLNRVLVVGAVVVTFFMRLENKYWWDLLSAISMMFFVDVFLVRSSWTAGKKIFTFLGKHSANIFMLHTFFVAIYWQEFTYSFRKPAVIYMVVLLCSLGCSMLIEQIKKWTRYSELQSRICKIKFEETVDVMKEDKVFDKVESLKVKGIAILLLLFHHLFYSLDRVNSSGMKFMLFSEEIVSVIGKMARVCVWLFVFISAYGLTCQYEKRKEDAWHFVLKRWISLMKQYWFVFIIVIIISAIQYGNPFIVYEGNILYGVLDFMAWSDFFGTPMRVGVWWYMSLAQIIVLLIPIVSLICKKFGWSSIVLGFVALQYLSVGIESPYGGKYSNYFLVIMLGVLCAQNKFLDNAMAKQRTKTIKYTLLFFIVLLSIAKYTITDVDTWQFGSLLNSIVALLICWFICCYIKTDGVVGKALEFMGIHSGNMYLFHALLYSRWPNLVYWSKNTVLSYLTLLILSILISMVFEYVKEKIKYDYYVDRILSPELIKNRVKENEEKGASERNSDRTPDKT